MKRLLFFILLSFYSQSCFSQAYIPMPTDSATWRYRIYDIDYNTQILDNILFLNGTDTVANGITYHRIINRTAKQVGGLGFNPPYVSLDATIPDLYDAAIRESGKQVFLLAGASEQMIYDFTALVGDTIPTYTGRSKVTAIDSILLNGVYHKRYLTADTTYFAIEGVGSNWGLLQGLSDGAPDMVFVCFSLDSVTVYTPDSTIPCTYIYPPGYIAPSAVSNINEQKSNHIDLYPVPANDVLHVKCTGNYLFHASVFNSIGQQAWNGVIDERSDISVSSWPKGLYYIQLSSRATSNLTKKFIVE